MSLCQFRTERECGCPTDTCVVQPVTPAPVVTFSWRDQLAMVAFGCAVALSVYFAMSAWNEQLGKDAIINQEISHVERR